MKYEWTMTKLPSKPNPIVLVFHVYVNKVDDLSSYEVAVKFINNYSHNVLSVILFP